MCYEKFSASVALNRHLLTCNAPTKEVYPPENSYISYDDKKAAKYASPLSIMGFADFETKLDGGNSKDDLADALKSKESFTDRKNIHMIVSFSIIFLDTDGKMIFEKNFCGRNAGEYFFQTLDTIEVDLVLRICKNL